jgi:hypothetical protein
VLQSHAPAPHLQHAIAPGHIWGGVILGLQQALEPGPHARQVDGEDVTFAAREAAADNGSSSNSGSGGIERRTTLLRAATRVHGHTYTCGRRVRVVHCTGRGAPLKRGGPAREGHPEADRGARTSSLAIVRIAPPPPHALPLFPVQNP